MIQAYLLVGSLTSQPFGPNPLGGAVRALGVPYRAAASFSPARLLQGLARILVRSRQGGAAHTARGQT